MKRFIYTYQSKSDEKVTWRCVDYNTKKFRARVCNMEDDDLYDILILDLLFFCNVKTCFFGA